MNEVRTKNHYEKARTRYSLLSHKIIRGIATKEELTEARRLGILIDEYQLKKMRIKS